MFLGMLVCVSFLGTLISAEPKPVVEDPNNASVRANRAKRYYYSWTNGTPGTPNWSYHYRYGDGDNPGCNECAEQQQQPQEQQQPTGDWGGQ